MLPESTITSVPVASSFITPKRTDPLIDYELGGIALQDSSLGLNYQLWEGFYKYGWIKLKNSLEEINLLQIGEVSSLSISFDFNMNPIVAYTSYGETYLYWYDTTIQSQVTTSFGNIVKYPQLSLDDNRLVNSVNADIIFAYVKGGSLYYRQQRDRYLIEYLVGEVPEGLTLIQIGMNTKHRFQFEIY